MKLTVNGTLVDVQPAPGEMLADLLRKRLGLTGTKIGCGEAECGTCTVLVDGQAVLSCTYPAERAAGREVLTIEGLARGRNLHPLQQAFVSHGAVQCGFCIPGQLMTSYALLQSNPQPTSKEIRHALKDTLCRCAGYPSIESAILEAARAMRTGQPVVPREMPFATQDFGAVGRWVPRPDAIPKVTGAAIFSDDLTFEGMLFAGVKRAGVPHAVLTGLDVSRARQMPGVAAVLTAADLTAVRTHGLILSDWPILVGMGEQIRTVGDALAIVAADSPEAAAQALEAMTFSTQPLPVVADPVQSRRPDAPQIHPNGNLIKHIEVSKGQLSSGFQAADVVLEHTFHTQTTDHAFLEPECSIARPVADGRMEIYVGSQIPYADRDQVARALGWPPEQVRVIGQLIGGGFGGKEDIAGQIHAALLAQATGRTVKLTYDRSESLIAHPKRHATQIAVKLGARRNGRLQAVETELYGDSGAYASLGEKVMARATTHSSGPYDIPHTHANCFAMYTNNPPAGAFRGFGVTQSCFAIESLMDDLSARLDIDPIELRCKNALQIGSLTCTGQQLRESVGLLECIDRVKTELGKLAPQNPFAPRPVAGQPDWVSAWGFAVAYKNTGLGGGAPDKAEAEVELFTDGTAEARISSAELGQGLVTVLQMITAQQLSLPLEKVRVLLSDTDLTPDGGPTTASRQTYVSGNAVRGAADALRQAICATLAEKWDTPPEQIRFEEGLARCNGHQVSLGEAAGLMQAENRQPRTRYQYWAPATKPLGQGGDMHFAFSFAAQAAEVAVNRRTGQVRVLRVIAATDVGKAVNPLGLLGQIEGGVMMGLGNALTEHFITQNGIPFTDRLARYRIPSIIDTPQIIPIVVEHPTADGPYGAKGIGEIVSIPTTPAITNAIFRAVGVRIDSLPVDQEVVLQGIQRQREGK